MVTHEEKTMQPFHHLRENDARCSRRSGDSDRGSGSITCIICAHPLADHEIGDHDTDVVQKMLSIGFPTPVGGRLS